MRRAWQYIKGTLVGLFIGATAYGVRARRSLTSTPPHATLVLKDAGLQMLTRFPVRAPSHQIRSSLR